MNKTEIAVAVLLFVSLIGWGYLQRQKAQELQAKRVAAAETVSSEDASPVTVAAAGAPETGVADAALAGEVPALTSPTVPATADLATVEATVETAPAVETPELPETRIELSSPEMDVFLSSWGGGIAAVRLKEYRATIDADSGPLMLDFSATPALSISHVPGLGQGSDFEVFVGADGSGVVRRKAPSGLALERSIRLGEQAYTVGVKDVLVNNGLIPIDISDQGVALGPMASLGGKASARGIAYMGFDTLPAHGGEGVIYWAKNRMLKKSPVNAQFEERKAETGELPASVHVRGDLPVSWVAAKNKFFVQAIIPSGGAADCELFAERDVNAPKGILISSIRGSALFADKVLQPGESLTREMLYYVGPKKYAILRKLGDHLPDVMEFGKLSWLCKPLLVTLNYLYKGVRNYGVAIILLTIFIKFIFWPITRKSTESMKKMQKIQPLVTAVRAKYKDKPQKMNQEVMALYKKHKVNPMAGCLPIMVQIPVFIALFTVLRCAIELRFAEFLWVKDLSEPEGLLAGVLPIPGGLNILPIFMTVTMIWQQRLTPTAGDPQQQKMMMFMPVIMLFIFYSMPSALVLYWSVSQSLSIVQLLRQRSKGDEPVAKKRA